MLLIIGFVGLVIVLGVSNGITHIIHYIHGITPRIVELPARLIDHVLSGMILRLENLSWHSGR